MKLQLPTNYLTQPHRWEAPFNVMYKSFVYLSTNIEEYITTRKLQQNAFAFNKNERNRFRTILLCVISGTRVKHLYNIFSLVP